MHSILSFNWSVTGSVGGKTPTEPKVYSSSNLRHIEQDKVDVYVFCLNLTWVIGLNNEHECSIKSIGQIKFLNLMEG
jgi:hypothetical protein